MGNIKKGLVAPLVESKIISDLSNPSFMDSYLEYAGAGKNEVPVLFHRWCCMSMVSALLGRQAYFLFGHEKIYPNQYVLLMGAPATRKNTALNISNRLLRATGYTRFAPNKSSKEEFLAQMKQTDDDLAADDLEVLELDGPNEIYVALGEFIDFMGQNNHDFALLLTNLWDNLDEYKNPKRTSKHVMVKEPTVNILAGATPQNFALGFPPESIGTGFMSRLLLVHGETTGRKITWPPPADDMAGAMLVDRLRTIKELVKGEIVKGKGVEELGKRMYEECVNIDDHRFEHYAGRRFTHLLKIAIVLAGMDLSTEITTEHMLKANTILAYTERKMPKALGEFGKSKYSEVTHTILSMLDRSTKPFNINQIWRKVSNDLSKLSELVDIIKNLQYAGKIQKINVGGVDGFLRNHEEKANWNPELLLDSWLTDEEKL
jgi:hypothetical protein